MRFDVENVNAITSHLVLAGSPGILRRRTWRARLLSWPWRPWIDVEFVPGWVGHVFARNDARAQEGGGDAQEK